MEDAARPTICTPKLFGVRKSNKPLDCSIQSPAKPSPLAHAIIPLDSGAISAAAGILSDALYDGYFVEDTAAN